MGEDYHTRLPNDMARGVDQYAADHDVTNSETLRRAVGTFLEEEGYPKELAPDGGVAGGGSAKAWAAERLGKWADRSMYVSLFVGLFGVGIGAPIELGWAEPTLPIAVIFVVSFSLFALFALVGGVLSIIGVALYLSMGVELKDALPWRRPA